MSERTEISDNFIQLFERYIKMKSTHFVFMTVNFMWGALQHLKKQKKCRTKRTNHKKMIKIIIINAMQRKKKCTRERMFSFHLLFMSYRSHCHYLSCTILLFSIHFKIFSHLSSHNWNTLSHHHYHRQSTTHNPFTILINMRGLVFTQK